MIVNMAMSLMSIVFATILRFHLKRLNKKLDLGEAVEGVNSHAGDRERREAAEEQGLPGIAADNGFRFLV